MGHLGSKSRNDCQLTRTIRSGNSTTRRLHQKTLGKFDSGVSLLHHSEHPCNPRWKRLVSGRAFLSNHSSDIYSSGCHRNLPKILQQTRPQKSLCRLEFIILYIEWSRHPARLRMSEGVLIYNNLFYLIKVSLVLYLIQLSILLKITILNQPRYTRQYEGRRNNYGHLRL